MLSRTFSGPKPGRDKLRAEVREDSAVEVGLPWLSAGRYVRAFEQSCRVQVA